MTHEDDFTAYVAARTPAHASGPEGDDAPVPSGIHVVGLEAGSVLEIPLPGAEGTTVERIAWSGDGRWIAWTGCQHALPSQEERGTGSPASGRIAPGATSSETVTRRRTLVVSDISIDDDVVTTSSVRDRTIERWDSRPIDRRTLPDSGGLDLAARPDGTLVAVGGFGADLVALLDPRTGRSRELSDTDAADPLGWSGDDVVALGGLLVEGERELLLAGDDGTQSVARVTTGVRYMSVAVDLVSADRLGVERDAPDWPWTDRTWSIVIGAGVAVAISLLTVLRWLWRRWRSRAG